VNHAEAVRTVTGFSLNLRLIKRFSPSRWTKTNGFTTSEKIFRVPDWLRLGSAVYVYPRRRCTSTGASVAF
jgi:hypothetical protein